EGRPADDLGAARAGEGDEPRHRRRTDLEADPLAGGSVEGVGPVLARRRDRADEAAPQRDRSGQVGRGVVERERRRADGHARRVDREYVRTGGRERSRVAEATTSAGCAAESDAW